MFSWQAPKGRPGEQSIVGKIHCLGKKKKATKAEQEKKKKKFSLLSWVFTGAKSSTAELLTKLKVRKETIDPLPFL